MTLILFGITGAAALAVAAYHLLNRDLDAAAHTLRRIREAIAVILVVAQATRAVLDALQSSQRPSSTLTAPHHPPFDDEREEFGG